MISGEAEASANSQMLSANQAQADEFYGKEESKETQDSITEESTFVTESTKESSEDTQETEVADSKESQEEGESKEEDLKLSLSENSLLDDKYLEEITSFAKENKLSKEAAQKLLDKQEGFLSKMMEAQEIEFKNQVDAWAKEVINDPQLGGENLSKTQQNAQKVLKRFGSEELNQILRDTGYGNNIHVVKFFATLGSIMSNDSLVIPGTDHAKPKSVEEIFYGNN